MEQWLASTESSLRPATKKHYRILLEKHLAPALGRVLLKDLSPHLIQHTYDEWLHAGIGAPTVVKIHALLHKGLARAEKTGLVVRNPAGLVTKPRPPEKEMKFWTEEQSNRFLTIARGNRLYGAFYLALVTGCRQMELLGLQWADLDWIKRTLMIRRQLARKNGDTFAPIKTRAGRRTLELGAGTVAVLREHLQLQQLERQIAGERWQENDLLFTSKIGTPMHHKNLIDRYYKPLVRSAGVPKVRFHDLRHTAVAIMLSHGVPIFTVSKIIGHARPSITSDTYGHLVPGAASDVGQMMDELIMPIKLDLEIKESEND